jgi:polar amino acid transport system substrate-binding protein
METNRKTASARCTIGPGVFLATIVVAFAASAASTLEQARESGSIRIGFANEAPFGYATPDGTATGEAPEIATRIFKKLGIAKVDAVLTEWASLIPGLRARRFDVIAAGMFITPARCKQVAFSNPTYRLGQGFLVKAGNPLALHSYKDAAGNSAAMVAVMAGAIEQSYAEKAGIPEERILTLPDQVSMLSAVQFGRADAAALTALSVRRMADKGGERVDVAAPFKTPDDAYGYGAFAFRKDDKALRDAFDKALAAFIGGKEHLALVAPFGFTKAELPGKASAAKLCGG